MPYPGPDLYPGPDVFPGAGAEPGPVSLELYEQVEPLAYADDQFGHALLGLCIAICAPLEPIAALVRDSDDGPGWSAAVDVDRAPGWVLPWLAQFAGVRLLPQAAGETTPAWVASMRDRIRRADGRWRGTPDAIVASVQRTLTGARTVHLVERWGGDAYALLVRTSASETPDPAASERAALEQKPAGIVLTFATAEAWDEAAASWDTAPAVAWNDADSGI